MMADPPIPIGRNTQPPRRRGLEARVSVTVNEVPLAVDTARDREARAFMDLGRQAQRAGDCRAAIAHFRRALDALTGRA
jgi:hypothetical protein